PAAQFRPRRPLSCSPWRKRSRRLRKQGRRAFEQSATSKLSLGRASALREKRSAASTRKEESMLVREILRSDVAGERRSDSRRLRVVQHQEGAPRPTGCRMASSSTPEKIRTTPSITE